MSMYEVMHSGAWLPVCAWGDNDAWHRLIDWAEDNCENFVPVQIKGRRTTPIG
jgi:hypothetical protein